MIDEKNQTYQKKFRSFLALGMACGMTSLVDAEHHIAGILLVYLAIRWARTGKLCKT